MKLDTAILITKGSCYVGAGMGAAFTAAIAQWCNSGDTPSKLEWAIIGVTCATAGFTQLLGFLSSSYKNYTDSRVTNGNGNGNGTAPATPVKP